MSSAFDSKWDIDVSRLSVKLRAVELLTGATDELIKQHLTVNGTFIIPLGGYGKLRREHGSVELEPDHVYACAPESTFGLEAEEKGELSVCLIRLDIAMACEERPHLDAEQDEQRLATRLFEQLDGRMIGPPGHAAALSRSVLDHFASGEAMKRWRARLDCEELLYELIATGRKDRQLGTRGALERVRAYIDDHYNEEIVIERLAGIAELSPKYFVDIFKKTYGVSAMDYLAGVRINRAKMLMLRSDRLLRDIAHEVGYADEFYFSRKFKQIAGMSPSAYMKKRGRKVAAYGSTSLTGYLLALGIVPFAAPLHLKWSRGYYDRYGADIPVHLDAYRQNHYKESNIAKLESARPELIVSNYNLEQWEKDRLSAIAPVFEMPEDGCGWREKLIRLAEWLGEEQEAQRWFQQFEEKSLSLRASIRAQAKPYPCQVLSLKLLKDKLYVHNSFCLQDVLYDELGLLPAESSLEPEENQLVTLQQLSRLKADLVLLLVCQESETLEHWAAVKQSTEWMSLPHVVNRKLHLIESDPWREYSPLAIVRMLEDMASLLTGNRP
ncbi:helix-turn-helix domain-containing protein [Paenibacillus sp. NPDC057967]|uniref:helix-turn-helix domain-containing protein n=1 Tax=Paenibacillus sp. NPDC057967 TaxID=3346293 RepID=UPI0036DF26FD